MPVKADRQSGERAPYSTGPVRMVRSAEEQLRGVFARHVGILPRAYRDRFALA
jgi:hypothetical protein